MIGFPKLGHSLKRTFLGIIALKTKEPKMLPHFLHHLMGNVIPFVKHRQQGFLQPPVTDLDYF